MTAATAPGARLEALVDQAVQRLVDAHAARTDEPLVVAVRFDRDATPDIHLLEVIEGFPGPDDDEMLETEFGPSPELRIMGALHLTLASPGQLRTAVARGSGTVQRLTADGVVLHPNAAATGEAAALLRLLGLHS